jgi:Ca2+-transporting ATPase
VPDPAPPSWHALAPEACLAALAAAPQGLTTEQASERLAALGPNRLEPEPGRGRLRILFDQFGNVMLQLLLAVAAVAAWLDLSAQRLPRDTIAIGLIVALNAALGYLQESRAERALQALRQLAQPLVSVCRDGQWQVLAAEQLVPGERRYRSLDDFDVRDAARVNAVLAAEKPAVVFHAAAYKHVPLMETDNAWQAVENNIGGTRTVARKPPSGEFVSVISPPWARAMSRAMASPSPEPP